MTAVRLVLVVAFLAGLVLAPGAARVASACSCLENPPCAAMITADAVVVGTVLESKRESLGGSLGRTVHTVAVSRTLRGSADPLLTLVTGMSSCDYPFQSGEQYVIYLRRTPSGRWDTSVCAGTKPLAWAAEDLDYFADLVTATPDARVYGSVSRSVLDQSTGFRTMPAAGVSIAVTGAAARFTVTSDAKGEFDLRLPPGDYSVDAVVPSPSAVRAPGALNPVSLPPYSCAPVHFELISRGRVEGRVVHPDGMAAVDASVDLIPADAPFDSQGSLGLAPSRRIDSQGQFAIGNVIPGRYLLAVNARFGPRAGSPYKTSYLVSRNGEPRVLNIGEGEQLTGFTIVVTPLTQTTIAGRVTFADGRPAPDVNVSAVPVDFRGSVVGSTKTNSTGDFELLVFTGFWYVVSTGATTPAGSRQAETVIAVDGPQEGLQLRIQP